MGFEVVLQHHEQAEFVAGVEEPRVWGVVGGAYGVHAVLFHHHQVGAEPFLADNAALVGVELVAIHPAHPQRPTVDQQFPADHPHRSETDLRLNGLAVGRQSGGVKPGGVAVPRHDLAQIERQQFVCGGEGLLEVQVVDAQRDRPGVVGRGDFGDDAAAPGAVVVAGVQPEVVDASGGASDQADTAEDTGQPPLVLVLHVGHGRPLVDPDVQQVASRPEQVGDVEFGA